MAVNKTKNLIKTETFFWKNIIKKTIKKTVKNSKITVKTWEKLGKTWENSENLRKKLGKNSEKLEFGKTQKTLHQPSPQWQWPMSYT